MVILVSPHRLKAFHPRDVTELGIVMDFKLLQFWKVESPIVLILFGIVTDEIPELANIAVDVAEIPVGILHVLRDQDPMNK